MTKGETVRHFQPDGWHTVTPRIITPKPEEVVHFVKEVFRGQGEFDVNRPAEIRIGDSLKPMSETTPRTATKRAAQKPETGEVPSHSKRATQPTSSIRSPGRS